MNWEDELHIRVYTRDTDAWKNLGWKGQTVLLHLLRKFNAAGVLKFKGQDPIGAIYNATNLPVEVIKTGLEKCLQLEVLSINRDALWQPKFVESQTAKYSKLKRNRRWKNRIRIRIQIPKDDMASSVAGSKDDVVSSLPSSNSDTKMTWRHPSAKYKDDVASSLPNSNSPNSGPEKSPPLTPPLSNLKLINSNLKLPTINQSTNQRLVDTQKQVLRSPRKKNRISKKRLQQKKKESKSHAAKVARKHKIPKTPKRKSTNGKSDPSIFLISAEERKQILSLFAPGVGTRTKGRKEAAQQITSEVIRVYKEQRLKVMGSDFYRAGEKGRKAALSIGLACIGNETTPERLIQYWLDGSNNWTGAKFPALTFIGNETQLEPAICSLVDERTKRGKKSNGRKTDGRRHGFEDVSGLHPELRKTLLDAGCLEGERWTDQDLLSVQNAAKTMANGNSPALGKVLRMLAEHVLCLFRKEN